VKESEPVRKYQSARNDQEIPYATPNQRGGEVYQRRLPLKHPSHEWEGRRGKKKAHRTRTKAFGETQPKPNSPRYYVKSFRPCRSTQELTSRPALGSAPTISGLTSAFLYVQNIS